MRARPVAAVVALSLAACSGGEAQPADPTVPTAPSTSSTTAPVDISVVPETIDEPYLNAVLLALDEIDGDAARIIVATKTFNAEAADILNAIYSDERLERQSEAWFRALADDPQLSAIKSNPGNRKTTVERIITARPDCVWLAVERDHSANSTAPGPTSSEYVALRPLDRSNDPEGRNPTPWMITVEGFNPDGSEPGNQCDES